MSTKTPKTPKISRDARLVGSPDPTTKHPDSSSDTPSIACGSKINRFILIEQLGKGGMGQVFSAYDPELDRRIAIKLMLQSGAPKALGRFIREAQTMAALNHPNIVPIFDVGTVEFAGSPPGLYIAMELVDGQTMRQWLDAKTRSLLEILEVFIAAGHGLAAIHEAGLIHRDFKPSNVMIDSRGRVRVMDFGLARITSLMPKSPQTDLESVRLEDLTRTGRAIGTPAYMAPEQHMGSPLDQYCDQYGFCVALWEALYGVRPFKSRGLRGLFQAKLDAKPTVPPSSRPVPRRLRQIMLRGLQVSRDARFTSIHALVELLQQYTKQVRSRRRLDGIAGVSLVGGLSAVVYLDKPVLRPCRGGQDRMTAVWDPSIKTRVEAAFVATEVAYADQAWQRVGPLLDDYAIRWISMYTEACTTTWQNTSSPGVQADLGLSCLDDRLDHFEALVRTLAAANASIIEHAVLAINNLPALSRCTDQRDPRVLPPLPDDPQVQAQVSKLRAQLTRAKMLRHSGQYEQGLELAVKTWTQGEALGYEPLLAELALTLGSLQDHVGSYPQAAQLLHKAYFKATAWGMDDIAARAAVYLIYVVGHRQAQHDVALGPWADHATAAVERLGDPRIRASLFHHIGIVYQAHGQYERSLESHRRALSIQEQVLGPLHPDVAASLSSIGLTYRSQGQYKQALESLQQALFIHDQALGSLHPHTAIILSNIAMVYDARGQYEQALTAYHRALSIYEQSLDTLNPDIADTLNNVGIIYFSQGRYERALTAYQRALSIYEQSLGSRHPGTANVLNNIGLIYGLQGRHQQALEFFLRALSISEQALTPLHPDIAIYLNNIGTVHRTQGQHQQALDCFHRALSINDRALGPLHPATATSLQKIGQVYSARGDHQQALDLFRRALSIYKQAFGSLHPGTARTLGDIGVVELSQGHFTAAINSLERAISIYEQIDAAPEDRAMASFALARALTEAHRERPRARRLALSAREDILAAEGEHRQMLAEIDAWIAAHRH